MNDEVLVRYLLGSLGPEDAERLDEASIVDDETATRLRTVEHDLVDRYVRGTLTGDTLARFESHYLSSPRRRELVTFARSFVPAVDRAGALPEAAVPRRSAVSALFRPSILAVAAALLLVASGALLLQNARLKRGLSAAQSERATLGERTRELEQQVAGLRPADTAGTTEPAPTKSPATAGQAAPAIALLLLPQTRSIGSIPTLSIPAGTVRVGLELRLESIDFPRYQAGLRDPAVNAIVWRSDWIAATSAAGGPSLRIAVPAGLLKPQHYSFDLSGQRPGGATEVVGSYALEIVPR